jgi:nitrate/nitrite-specific signal transduction histidine kinase
LAQAVDRLIVQLQDNIHALRLSDDENIKKEISIAKQYIQDADKLKQLLLKFHLCTDDSDVEAEFAQLSTKFYQASQEKLKVKYHEYFSDSLPIF